MAWFEGLSSLKGQLTNLAKGVLTEENEGPGSGVTSPSVSTSTDKELTADETNKEAKAWNDAFASNDNYIDPATVHLSSWSNEESQQDIEEKTSVKVVHDPDDEVPSIIPRGLANFFNHHVSVVSTSKNGAQVVERGVQTEGELQSQIRTLTEANRRLLQYNANLTSEVASLTRVVEDLESQVAVSQDENANLSTGLEELDIQHQQAIEQVLVVKNETQKQYEVLQKRYSELESNFEKELKQRLEQKQNEKRDAGTMYEVELISVGTECNTEGSIKNIDLMKELEERDNELELVVCENARLREVVKELKEELERQSDSLPAIPENSEEVEALELRVSTLENEILILREVRTNLETEVASSRTIIEDLTRRLQISDAMIRNQDSALCDEDKVAAAVREQCEQELQAVRNHCEKVESSLRSLELQSGDALAKLRREVDEKDRRREELERELERLQNEIGEERRQFCINLDAENASLKKKISQLQSQLQDTDTQLDESQKEIEIKDKKMCALLFELNTFKEELHQMELNYKSLNDDHAALNAQVNSSKKDVCTVETQVSESATNSSRTVTNLENEIKYQQEMHSKLENELKLVIKELRLVIKERELEIQSTKDSEIVLKEEIECKSILCEDLQEQLIQLQSKIEDLDAKSNKLQINSDLEKEVLLKQLDTLKAISHEFDVSKDIFKQKEMEFKNQLHLKDEELTKCIIKFKAQQSCLEGEFDQIKVNLEQKITEKDKEIEENIKNEKETRRESELLILEFRNGMAKLEQELKEAQTRMENTMQENLVQKQFSNELQRNYENLIKLTDSSSAESKSERITLLNEVDKLNSELEKKEVQLKEAKDISDYGTQMCESIREEFLKKLEQERLDHQREIEMITQTKLSVDGMQEQIDHVQIENNELKKNIQLKISECHNNLNEIERLNSLLIAEKSKFEKMLQDKLQEIANEKLNTANFEIKLSEIEELLKNKNKENSVLSQEVDSLKNQLEYVSQLLNVVDRQEAEGQPSTDATLSVTQNHLCPNGCKETQEELNRLTGALLKEQTENKILKNQVEDLSEKVGKATSQLSKLQSHLLSVEDNYTSELQTAKSKMAEMQAKLVQADDRARNSSTAYTSANIRANQQVESLNQQLRLLTEHKEKLEAELSKSEDSVQRQNAAVTNLQAVLHQFQRDKQKDIDFETERLRQTLNAQCKKNDDLFNEIKHLQEQLVETKKGLAAANRLTEQLDQKSETISAYKKQVDELLTKLKTEEDKVKAANSNVEGKIDRNLMKNLMVGYLCSPNNSKLQVLKVLAQVLDLNKEERQKIGLESVPTAQQQSLSEAFIRFLESESQPKPQIFLPLNQPSTSAPPSRKTSQSGGSLLLTDAIPNLPHFTVGRNSGSLLKDVLKDRNT